MWWYLISIILVLFLVWISIMYFLWKKSTPDTDIPIEQALGKKISLFLRIVRKVRFTTERALKQVRFFVQKLTAKLFFFVFPSAKKAFESKDELAGLDTGPSSYFLMSVSEYAEQAKKKKAGRKKKIV